MGGYLERLYNKNVAVNGVPIAVARDTINVTGPGAQVADNPITKQTDITFTGSALAHPSVAALKDSQPAIVAHDSRVVSGYAADGDGGGGQFVWKASDSSADDGGTVFASTFGGAPSGRWRRIFSGPLDVRWFGAKCDGATDDTAAIQAAINAAATVTGPPLLLGPGSADVRIPPGIAIVTASLNIPAGVNLVGAGKTATTIQLASTAAPCNILSSSHPINSSTTAHISVRDLTIISAPTFPLTAGGTMKPYANGFAFTAGQLVFTLGTGCRLLKCVTSGTTGAHTPFGQLTPSVYPDANTVTLSGTPSSDLPSIDVAITVPGLSNGTAQFQYSIDGATFNGSNIPVPTGGGTIALGGTGVSATFTNGTYAGIFYMSPSFKFSMAVGTTIVDGSCHWQIVDGGSGFCDVGGSGITLQRVRIVGANCQIILDQTEFFSATECDFIFFQGNMCGEWLTGNGDHSPGAGGAFTNVILHRLCNYQGYGHGVVDDGGVNHDWSGCEWNACNLGWIYLGGPSGVHIHSAYIEANGGQGSPLSFNSRLTVGPAFAIILDANYVAVPSHSLITFASTVSQLVAYGNIFTIRDGSPVFSGMANAFGSSQFANQEENGHPIFDRAPITGDAGIDAKSVAAIPNMLTWIRADFGVSLPGGVMTASDLSGNGHDFAAGSTNPTMAVMNHLPCFRMGTGAAWLRNTSFPTGLTAIEGFIVFQCDSDPPGSNGSIWGFGTGAADEDNATDGHMYSTFGSTILKDAGVHVHNFATKQRVVNVRSAAGAWSAYVDNTLQFTTGSNVVATPTTAYIGTSPSFGGAETVAEVILFSRVLTADERSTVLLWLSRWGVTVN